MGTKTFEHVCGLLRMGTAISPIRSMIHRIGQMASTWALQKSQARMTFVLKRSTTLKATLAGLDPTLSTRLVVYVIKTDRLMVSFTLMYLSSGRIVW